MILRVPSSFPSYFPLFFPILLSFLLTFPSVYPEPSTSAISNRGDRGGANNRKDKLLNVFNIVRFPNDACNTTQNNVYGVCYTSTECTALGGESSGSCASGFGVCCAFKAGCGSTFSLNNTYISGDGDSSSPCSYTVCKCSSDICQIRLNFETFVTHQPVTTTPTDDNPSVRTQCQAAQFSAHSEGHTVPIICGINTGYHMILEADDSCNPLQFTWTDSGTRSWNIHVMQIACTDTWKPPEGCLQYYTGITDTIQSYNFAGGMHIANQDYTNCIRQEMNYCSIDYAAATSPQFLIGATPTIASSYTGTNCLLDFVIIPAGAAIAGSTTNVDRHCGGLLNAVGAADITVVGTVSTNKKPFTVGFVTDALEMQPAASTAEAGSVGFEITYTQQSTNC